MLESKYFTAEPAGKNSNYLLAEYNDLLFANLFECLDAIQLSLKIDLSFVKQKYVNLQGAKRFSPELYVNFSRLIAAVKSENLQDIIDGLHYLRVSNDHALLDSNFTISSILSEFWENPFVSQIRSDKVPSKSGEETLVLPIISPDLTEFESTYVQLLECLKEVDINFYHEIQSYVTRLKLFNGRALKAATSASAFGAIYLRIPPRTEDKFAFFADHIIHETSHLQLDILLAFDRIVLNDPVQRFQAPIRIDPRPMIGIFHATFVLSRMVRVFKRLKEVFNNADIITRCELFESQFANGFETIDKYAELTDNGKKIKESFLTSVVL